jgi:manganese efflux pump family protein
MSSIFNFFLALGVAMDAFAVSISCGNKISPIRRTDALKLASFFGGCEAFMLVIGWLGGNTISDFVSEYAIWFAFLILVFIGGKMIYETFYGNRERKINSFSYPVLLALAVAISIDSLFMGMSFAFLKTTIIEPAIIIGFVTFLMSFCGVILGSKVGHLFEREVNFIGGLIMICIGVSLLIFNH